MPLSYVSEETGEAHFVPRRHASRAASLSALIWTPIYFWILVWTPTTSFLVATRPALPLSALIWTPIYFGPLTRLFSVLDTHDLIASFRPAARLCMIGHPPLRAWCDWTLIDRVSNDWE
jgi:hypothetical protein